MPKTIKKVELSNDDGLVDLRHKDRLQAGFKVKRIEESKLDIPFQAEESSADKTAEELQNQENQRFNAEDLNRRMESFAEKLEKVVVRVAPNDHHETAGSAKELIKVKFVKFVQLVASRDFVDILEKNQDEDIIISSNLLTDLAGAVDQKGTDKKIPIIFVIGLALGVVLTYFLINR